MKLHTRQTEANTAAERWYQRFCTECGKQWYRKLDSEIVYSNLVALGIPADPNEVDRITNNTSWTQVPTCSECGRCKEAVMQMGNCHDYDTDIAYLCLECLQEAVETMTVKNGPLQIYAIK